MITEVNLYEKFDLIRDHWSPKIVAELNGQYVKLAKVKDVLVWHRHQNEDELFIVYKGTLIMDFQDRTTETKPGGILIVPKNVLHCPRTNGEEVWVAMIEPKETKHTGEVEHKKTVKEFEWI